MLVIPEEVKILLKTDSVRKNFRIIFPDGEREDITNKHLIKESVSFTESLCSQNELKFGLCESSVIEFQTFDVGNINGCRIVARIEVDISSLSSSFRSAYGEVLPDLNYPVYVIRYGEFFVNSCERDATNFQQRKVVAYSREYEFGLTTFERYKQRTATTSASDYTVHLPEFILSQFNLLNDDEMTLQVVKWGNEDYGYGKMIINQKGQYKLTNVSTRNYTMTWASAKNTDVDSYHIGHNTDYTSLFKLEGNVDKAAIDAFDRKLKSYGIDMYTLRNGFTNDNEVVYTSLFAPFMDIAIPNTDGSFSAYIASNTPNMEPGKGYTSLIYPFIDDFYTQTKTYCAIYVPHTVKVSITDASTNRVVETITCTFAKDVKICKVNVNSNIMKIDASLNVPRVKYYNELVGAYRYRVEEPQGLNREFMQAVFELLGEFGKFDRTRDSAYKRIRINDKLNLYPYDKLFPADDIYPKGMDPDNCDILLGKHYIRAWYDDQPTKRYGTIRCKYKNTAGVEKETVYNVVDFKLKDKSGSQVYDPDDYQEYDISENYIIKNCTFTDTAMTEVLKNMANAIRDIIYMPADIEAVGLPYIEPGDVVEVITPDGGFDTVVLRRTLKGIQSLKDSYESKGR